MELIGVGEAGPVGYLVTCQSATESDQSCYT